MNPKRTIHRTSIIAVLTAAIALFFFAPAAHAETPPGTTGASNPATPPAPAPAAGEQAPKPVARKEDTDPTTLADAKSALKSARTERDTAEAERAQAVSERDAAQAENTRLADQFAAATNAATAAQAERDTARTERATAISERDIAQSALATANANVSRLEQLCKVKGVSPSAAVPLIAETTSEDQERGALVKTLTDAKTPQERGKAAEALRKFDAAQKKA